MNVKKWTVGIIVALLFSLLTAGAGLTAGMKWQAFIAVFCASALLNLGAYLMKHPVESIVEETATSSKVQSADGSTKTVDIQTRTETPVEKSP